MGSHITHWYLLSINMHNALLQALKKKHVRYQPYELFWFFVIYISYIYFSWVKAHILEKDLSICPTMAGFVLESFPFSLCFLLSV